MTIRNNTGARNLLLLAGKGGNMAHRFDLRLAFALTVLLASPAVSVAQEWVSVAKADSKEAFVDPASVNLVGNAVELRAKENFVAPQPAAKKDKTYLSSQNTYRFDCVERKVAIKEILAFPEADLQGKVVQKAKFYEKNLQWMDAPPDTVFGELLKYACERSPTVAPASPTG
jgi:hypothetical protein